MCMVISYVQIPVCPTLAADQTQTMQDQMSGAAVAMPQDPKAAFKAEWEALEITEYQNALANIETDMLMAASGPSDAVYHGREDSALKN